ncbi:MAG: energy-coupling factor transporter transmembrane protein EcfT [Planctomycetota bacterium]|nr:MAG: energy-coupling factor transporter transmembrane protein EcfT [Planctomycetota bacterium]
MLNDDLTNPAQDDSSWISKVQPGPRLLLGAGGAMITSFLDQPLPLGIVAVMTLAILTIRRVPLSWIWGRLLNLSWLLFAFALPLLWLGPGEGTWPLAMHPAGAHLGLVIMLKAVAVLTWSWVWLLGIDSVAWRQGARMVRLPDKMAEIGWLMGTFLPMLRAEIRQMRLALRLRGGKVTATLQGYHLISLLLGMSLWRSSLRAERIGVALRLRTAGPGSPPLPWTLGQGLVLAAGLFPLAALLTWQRLCP